MRNARIVSIVSIYLGAATLIGLGLISQADVRRGLDRTKGNPDLIVHEWGTFTSFSGSDSLKLEFRPLIDQDLPQFVLDRSRQQGVFNPLSKIDLAALQRMETPVTYFYTDRAQQVNVRVGFPQGLLTEFFPPVQTMLPKYDVKQKELARKSVLDWGKVWILPQETLKCKVQDAGLAESIHQRVLERLLPSSEGYDHYQFARETDSALVYVERTAEKRRPYAPQGAFFEKFLFYRGLGNFELPLKMVAHSDGNFEVTNLGKAPLRSLFLLNVVHDRLTLVQHPDLKPGETVALAPTATVSEAELGSAVTAALVADGLYEKEAQAMVNTWRTSWFGEQGTRLFYLLPQDMTDKLLPLDISPRPKQVIRVMVGRMEIMRPEDERRITEIVEHSVNERAAVLERNKEFSEANAYRLPAEVLELGRLAEPALVRIKNLATDSAVKYEAETLLRELNAHRIANATQ